MYLKMNQAPMGMTGYRGLRGYRRGFGAAPASGPQFPDNPNNLPYPPGEPTVAQVSQGHTLCKHLIGDTAGANANNCPMSTWLGVPEPSATVYLGFPMPGSPYDPQWDRYGGRPSDGTHAIMPVRDDTDPSHVSLIPPPVGTQDYVPGSDPDKQIPATVSTIRQIIAGLIAQMGPAQNPGATTLTPCPGALWQPSATAGAIQNPDGTVSYQPGSEGDQQVQAGACSWGYYDPTDPSFLKYGAPQTIYFTAGPPVDFLGHVRAGAGGQPYAAVPPGTPVVKSPYFNAYQYALPGAPQVAAPVMSSPAPLEMTPPAGTTSAPPPPSPGPSFFQQLFGGGAQQSAAQPQNSYPAPIPYVATPSFVPSQTPQLQPSPVPQAAQISTPEMVPAVQSVNSMQPGAPVSSGSPLDWIQQNPMIAIAGAAALFFMFSMGGKK
jgi:hypothetical protein